MPLLDTVPITVVAATALTLKVTLERLTDGFFWNRVSQTWTAPGSTPFASRTITLAEGAAENLGSYTGTVDGLGVQPDPGLVRIRVHSQTASPANLVIQFIQGYVKSGRLCDVDDFVSTRATPDDAQVAAIAALSDPVALQIDELTQVPPRKPTFAQAISLLYTIFRNRVF